MMTAVAKLLDEREREFANRLQSLDSAWQQRLHDYEVALRNDWQAQRAMLRRDQAQQLTEWEQAFQPELVALIQSGQLEQQRELRLLLSEFYAEWQQTRQADLQSIERQFVDLYREVEYNEQEVEAVLNELGRVGD